MSTKKSSPRSAKKKDALAAVPKQRRSHVTHVLSHHAYVLEHTTHDVPLRERFDVSAFNPEDVHEFVFSEGGVDEVRLLQERVYLKPRGKKALYLAACAAFTHQAQNALLKLLEDPPTHAVIVLGVASPRSLLETIHSRVHILTDTPLLHDTEIQPEELLHASLPQRLVLIEPFIEAKDIDAACKCIESVLTYIHAHYRNNHAVLLDQTKAAVSTSTYLRMQGAMMKMLLEAWVLTLPIQQISKKM